MLNNGTDWSANLTAPVPVLALNERHRGNMKFVRLSGIGTFEAGGITSGSTRADQSRLFHHQIRDTMHLVKRPKTLEPNTAEKNPVAKSEPIEVEATVTTALPNAMFKLRLDGAGAHEILGIVSGKMRKHFIRILPGDRVKVQLSPYDLTKGRIVFRQK